MARNHHGSSQRLDILAQTTVHRAGDGRQLGSEPYISQGSRIPSVGGLVLVRGSDERLGLDTLIDEHLSDSRQGANKKFPLADLLWQSVYSGLAGYEDPNDEFASQPIRRFA